MKYLSILIALFSISCSSGSNDDSTENGGSSNNKATLKVMSYNIHIANPPSKEPGFVDIDAIANAIKKESPDLVALQEVDRFTDRSGKELDQAKAIAEKTGMNYYFAKALDRSGGEYGVAVLSKFPIITSDKHALPGADGTESETRVIGVVEVEIKPGKKILFGSLHLDHITDVSRRAQVKEIITYLKTYSNLPIVLGGDFNMLPDNDIWYLINTTFTRGCSVCPGTFPATNATKTIDYFLLNSISSSMFEIKNYHAVQEKYASDHLPIVMDLEYSID